MNLAPQSAKTGHMWDSTCILLVAVYQTGIRIQVPICYPLARRQHDDREVDSDDEAMDAAKVELHHCNNPPQFCTPNRVQTSSPRHFY
eukprot:5257641-Amphidinium_carterae.3